MVPAVTPAIVTAPSATTAAYAHQHGAPYMHANVHPPLHMHMHAPMHVHMRAYMHTSRAALSATVQGKKPDGPVPMATDSPAEVCMHTLTCAHAHAQIYV